MKVITLKIDDKVYQDLRTLLATRKMMGSLYGIGDEILSKIIEFIEHEQSIVDIKYKDVVSR
jgi:hypothetical protein